MDKLRTLKLITISFSLLFSCLAFSQEQSYDSRLEAIFSKTQINNWQEKHPQIISYWEFYLNHAYIIIDQVEEKVNPEWPQIELVLDSELNIMALPHILNSEERQYFTIRKSNKMLLIFSQAEILSAFNLNNHKR